RTARMLRGGLSVWRSLRTRRSGNLVPVAAADIQHRRLRGLCGIRCFGGTAGKKKETCDQQEAANGAWGKSAPKLRKRRSVMDCAHSRSQFEEPRVEAQFSFLR